MGYLGSHRSTGLSLTSSSVDDDDDAVNVCCLKATVFQQEANWMACSVSATCQSPRPSRLC